MEILDYLKSELPLELYTKLEPDLLNLLSTYKQKVESETLHSVACYWSTADVLSINPLYTKDEAIELLAKLDHSWDASVGASWTDLEYICREYGPPSTFYPLVEKIVTTLIDPKHAEFEYLLDEIGEQLIICGDEVYSLLVEYQQTDYIPVKLLNLIKSLLNDLNY